jgi:hypothetical protein
MDRAWARNARQPLIKPEMALLMNMNEVLDPTGQIQKTMPLQCTPVSSLEGRRLAILDNSKPNFVQLATLVAERLKTDCSMSSLAFFRKENAAVGASPALLDQIAQSADLVLTGSAD